MNSREGCKIIGFRKILRCSKQPSNRVCLKRRENASNLLKQCCTLAKQSGKSNISILQQGLIFLDFA